MSCREWKEVKLGEVCDVTSSKRIFAKEYVQSGIPFYRGKEIIEKHNGANISTKLFISGEKYEEIKRTFGVPTVGDILLTSVGTLGIPYIVKNEKFYFKDGNLTWIKDFKQNMYNKFLNYWLISPLGKLQISHKTIGSTQQALTIRAIKSFVINLPPLPEQKAIAATLSCLDDMIELHNRTNQVLEEMAQAIFKHWFVDFEFPNEDGLPYKSSGGAMVDSELGEIPEGWRVDSLLDIADYLNGLAMQKFRPAENEKGYPVLKIKELRQGMTDSSSDLCSENIDPKYIVNDGDLIFSWSGSLLVDFWCGDKCGLNQHLFKVTSNQYDKWYYYLWTKYHLQKFIEIAKDKATTMGHIKRGDLEKSKVLVMDDVNYERLDSICKPIIITIITNRVENRKLTEIRDTLLPKLMSGEIRVPVEEVV